MEGAVITRAEVRRADLRFPFPQAFQDRLTGRLITSLGRRAKYLLVDLAPAEARSSDGAAGETVEPEVLVMHLGMSGSFRVETQALGDFHHERSRLAAHDHVVFHLSSGATVTYNDPRRFGFMTMAARPRLAEHALFAHLGVEPTGNDLSSDYLAEAFRDKSAPLKAALLDQSIIAGLGNIYVCEALFRAGLDPRRKAGTLVTKAGAPTAPLKQLVPIIRTVIAEAIEAGGSSLRDHAQTSGELGYFQHRFQVYDREDEPCLKGGCGGIVRRVVQSNRSTFYCPTCQK